MTKEQRMAISLLHARTKPYRYKVESAQRIIAKALDVSDSPYVALSGGKDSTVVFDLVACQYRVVPAIWSDDEYYLPETGQYIKRLQGRWHDVRQIRTNCKHAEFFETRGDFDSLQDYAKQQNFSLCFLGLRQEENSVRRTHLRKNGPLFFAKSEKMWHCNPIHDWTARDVWAYIDSNAVDYNHAYDKLCEIGIDIEYQRIGPLAVERVLGYGQIAILKKCWPDVYHKFLEKHPEAANYV